MNTLRIGSVQKQRQSNTSSALFTNLAKFDLWQHIVDKGTDEQYDWLAKKIYDLNLNGLAKGTVPMIFNIQDLLDAGFDRLNPLTTYSLNGTHINAIHSQPQDSVYILAYVKEQNRTLMAEVKNLGKEISRYTTQVSLWIPREYVAKPTSDRDFLVGLNFYKGSLEYDAQAQMSPLQGHLHPIANTLYKYSFGGENPTTEDYAKVYEQMKSSTDRETVQFMNQIEDFEHFLDYVNVLNYHIVMRKRVDVDASGRVSSPFGYSTVAFPNRVRDMYGDSTGTNKCGNIKPYLSFVLSTLLGNKIAALGQEFEFFPEKETLTQIRAAKNNSMGAIKDALPEQFKAKPSPTSSSTPVWTPPESQEALAELEDLVEQEEAFISRPAPKRSRKKATV